MRKIALLLPCLMPLLATAQAQEKIPSVTAIAPADRAVPASAVDAEGAYVEFRAVVSNGASSIELGRYLSRGDFARIQQSYPRASAHRIGLRRVASKGLGKRNAKLGTMPDWK